MSMLAPVGNSRELFLLAKAQMVTVRIGNFEEVSELIAEMAIVGGASANLFMVSSNQIAIKAPEAVRKHSSSVGGRLLRWSAPRFICSRLLGCDSMRP